MREGGPGSTLRTDGLASAEVWRGVGRSSQNRSRQNRATVEDLGAVRRGLADRGPEHRPMLY